MTRVDFYILSAEGPTARQRFACRIAEKAWKSGNRVYLHTASDAEARLMDELLWTYRQDSFVPHAVFAPQSPDDGPDETVAVLIGTGAAPPTIDENLDVLVSLVEDVPAFYQSFARVAEIVSADPPSRDAGRQRFRMYREQGCKLESHTM